MDAERLEMMLFDDQRIVTALTLSRHSGSLVEDAKESITSFYESNKGKNGLWAIYSITGDMERQGIVCKSTVLAKESELEEKKSNFQKITASEVFSLQVRDVEDVYSVFLADMMEDKDFFRSDNDRAPIKTKKIEYFRQIMETNHKDQLELIAKTIELSKTAGVKPVVTKKSTIVDKKPDIKKMFEKACTKEKTPRNSPKKEVRESPFSSPEESTSSDSTQKKRNRKIIIDDEDSLSPPAKEPKQEPETTPKKEEKPIVRSEKKESKNLLKEDIFDANASSPEKEAEPEQMEVDSPVKKSKKKSNSENKKPKKSSQIINEDNDEKPEEPVVRRSPRKHFQGGAVEKKKKMIKSYETFMDDEGFLVTKEVVREQSVEPEEAAVAKPLSPKKINQTTLTKPKTTKTANQQSKISSFFTKKA
ncbi:unnamed protein product [Auanema sp. JU1783]|nr:unnamed protein product [Auanema sp. JU1783]